MYFPYISELNQRALKDLQVNLNLAGFLSYLAVMCIKAQKYKENWI